MDADNLSAHVCLFTICLATTTLSSIKNNETTMTVDACEAGFTVVRQAFKGEGFGWVLALTCGGSTLHHDDAKSSRSFNNE
ncbi:MAG: hypothetical protein WD177_08200, partial [Methylophaga sp.]